MTTISSGNLILLDVQHGRIPLDLAYAGSINSPAIPFTVMPDAPDCLLSAVGVPEAAQSERSNQGIFRPVLAHF